MKTKLERRFESLDTLEPSDLRQESARRLREPSTRPLPSGPSPWKRIVVAALALTVFAGAAWFAWVAFRPDEPTGPTPRPVSPGPFNPHVAAAIDLGPNTVSVAVGVGGVWVGRFVDESERPCSGAVIRIDPATNEVAATVPVNGVIEDVAVGFGSVWAEGYRCFNGGRERESVALLRRYR
jgi:hypothetical protein